MGVCGQIFLFGKNNVGHVNWSVLICMISCAPLEHYILILCHGKFTNTLHKGYN